MHYITLHSHSHSDSHSHSHYIALPSQYITLRYLHSTLHYITLHTYIHMITEANFVAESCRMGVPYLLKSIVLLLPKWQLEFCCHHIYANNSILRSEWQQLVITFPAPCESIDSHLVVGCPVEKAHTSHKQGHHNNHNNNNNNNNKNKKSHMSFSPSTAHMKNAGSEWSEAKIYWPWRLHMS